MRHPFVAIALLLAACTEGSDSGSSALDPPRDYQVTVECGHPDDPWYLVKHYATDDPARDARDLNASCRIVGLIYRPEEP